MHAESLWEADWLSAMWLLLAVVGMFRMYVGLHAVAMHSVCLTAAATVPAVLAG